MTAKLKTAFVSVVMSVYNTEHYLETAIDSILNQTLQEFEFIIIDDGSSDGSTEISRRKAAQDSRIKLVVQENVGLTKSLNRAIAFAAGSLIARMDADDVAEPERLEIQVRKFQQQTDLVLLGCGVEMISDSGIRLGRINQPINHFEIRKSLLLGNGIALSHPSVMFKKVSFFQVGGYDEQFLTSQDLDLFLKLSETGKCENLEIALLRWRQHERSVNRTKSETWRDYKRLAISNTIKRIGIEEFSKQLFPMATTLIFPEDHLGLARLAYRNNRVASSVMLAVQSILSGKKPLISACWLLRLMMESPFKALKGMLRFFIPRSISS